MTLFDRYDRLASRAVDATNGIAYRIEPMAGGPNGPARPDPDRSTVSGLAVLEFIGGNPGLQTGNRSNSETSNDFHALRTAKTPTLSIDTRQLHGLKPRQGDLVEILDDGRRFEVVSAQPDGHSRVRVVLAAT